MVSLSYILSRFCIYCVIFVIIFELACGIIQTLNHLNRNIQPPIFNNHDSQSYLKRRLAIAGLSLFLKTLNKLIRLSVIVTIRDQTIGACSSITNLKDLHGHDVISTQRVQRRFNRSILTLSEYFCGLFRTKSDRLDIPQGRLVLMCSICPYIAHCTMPIHCPFLHLQHGIWCDGCMDFVWGTQLPYKGLLLLCQTRSQ